MHASEEHKLRVWVVEDDPLFRETVERLLAADNHIACARAFDSCEAAIEALEHERAPDVMLMDISLPGLSGVDGIRGIHAHAADTRIIMLTIHDDDDRIFRALCAGAAGYLLKPSSASEIIAAVTSAHDGGAPINPHIAARVLNMFARYAAPSTDYGLTRREHEVLEKLVAHGTKAQIAEALFVSPHTVDMHVRSIYAKLHVHSRSGAVAKALKERLI